MKPFQPAIVADKEPNPGAENEEASAPKIVEELIHRAERASASDIHLQMDHAGAAVSFRLDGLMTPATRTCRRHRRARFRPHQIPRALENLSGVHAAGRSY